MEIPPSGKRFSHIYLTGGEPTSDSPRMRTRLAVACPELAGLHSHLTAELGVGVSYRLWGRYGGAGIEILFFQKCALRDLLDAITLIYSQCLNDGFAGHGKNWLDTVVRVFREENVGYRVDAEGGVHYLVDSQFEGLRTAGISSLNGQRYANSRSLFDAAYGALDNTPPDGKSAVRFLFASVEGLFRLMFPSAKRLGTAEIKAHLLPVVNAAYPDDLTARRALVRMVGSFENWVEAAHFYRHEPGQEEVAQPPMTVAIFLMSEGAGYLRWLAEVDRWAK